jgi:hypothetical protein
MNSRSICLLALMGVVILSAGLRPAHAETYLVDDDEPAKFRTVQSAVDFARDGDVIIVNPGTYTGSGNRDIDLKGKALTIIGADPYDAAIVGATVIDPGGRNDRPHRAFTIADCNGVEIAGLTLINGVAPMGGAIYCRDSVLTLSHCRILDNRAQPGDAKSGFHGGPGGGIYGERAEINLVGCLVSGNGAGVGGASVSGEAGAGGDGGGIYAVDSSLTITGSTMTNNTAGPGGDSAQGSAGAGGRGGGIYADLVTIVDSVVSGNAAGDGGAGARNGLGGSGGGVHAETAVIDATRIEGNRAGAVAGMGSKGTGGSGGDGGGLYCAVLDLTNSLVAGNQTGPGAAGSFGTDGPGVGGGLWCTAGLIRHCTIVNNLAHLDGADAKSQAVLGAGVFCDSRTVLSHTILYGNTPDQLAGHDCSNVTYCNIEGQVCQGRSGNLSEPAMFIKPGVWVHADDANVGVEPDDPNAVWRPGEYRLLTGSPCIDAGDRSFVPGADETDLGGRSRLVDGRVDIGAFEAQTLLPVYRFWSQVSGKHFYTLDEPEKNLLIDVYPHVWVYEGIAYYAYAQSSEPGLVPVYRFWSPVLESHFYTSNRAEKDHLIDKYEDVWTFEGIVFYAYPEEQRVDGTKTVHRFWSDTLGGHFYTISEAEKDLLIREYSLVWTYEGAAWYAFEKPIAEKPPAVPDPMAYEFVGGQEDALFILELKATIDNKEAKLDSPTIGFIPEMGRMDMQVDLGAMTTRLDEFSIDSTPVEHEAVLSGGEIGRAELPITLSLQGQFFSPTRRGPYDIDPESLVFPAGQPDGVASADDDFRLVGSMTIDGRKLSIDVTLPADRFDIDGKARFDAEAAPDRLNAQMAGPFTWVRQHDDLLVETQVKERTVQLYVTYLRVQTMGLWEGRPSTEATK